ncbi:DUF5320 domain-containing protein [bacterium]|nr:DUF5320 domain-containing protein [bacterium]
MPFGDGTGPAGLGPMTGRAAGYCAGYAVPGYMNPVLGWGFGRGGRGRRRWFYASGFPGWQRTAYGAPYWPAGFGYMPVPYQANPEQERDMLKRQTELLEKTLSDLNQRIRELETEKKKKA